MLQLRAALNLINMVPDSTVRSAAMLCLSNTLREVSLQDPGDLRIRRRKAPQRNYPALRLFLQELEGLLGCMERTAIVRHLAPGNTLQLAVHGDCASAATFGQVKQRAFEAAVTFPPYANALPYIDTQRLSLVVLGLLDPAQLSAVDRLLIGSRDLTVGARHSLESRIERNSAGLPCGVHRFLLDLLHRTRHSDVGFRRRNGPALLYRYFELMHSTFWAVRAHLRPGAPYALVVGTNRTRIGGEDVAIPTPQFLGQIAEQTGFLLEGIEPLEDVPALRGSPFQFHQCRITGGLAG